VGSNPTLSATFLFFRFRHLSCEGPAPSDKSSAKFCHWGSIQWQSALSIGRSFIKPQSYLRGAVPLLRTRHQFRRRTLYRRPDEADIGFKRSVHPCSIGAPHRDQAMPVLARDEQGVLSDHEIPTDRRVPGAIGTTVALAQALQAQTPTLRGIAEVSNRCAIVLEEELVVFDQAARLEISIKGQLVLQEALPSGTGAPGGSLTGQHRVPETAVLAVRSNSCRSIRPHGARYARCRKIGA
jgi:hypothetical protein